MTYLSRASLTFRQTRTDANLLVARMCRTTLWIRPRIAMSAFVSPATSSYAHHSNTDFCLVLISYNLLDPFCLRSQFTWDRLTPLHPSTIFHYEVHPHSVLLGANHGRDLCAFPSPCPASPEDLGCPSSPQQGGHLCRYLSSLVSLYSLFSLLLLLPLFHFLNGITIFLCHRVESKSWKVLNSVVC